MAGFHVGDRVRLLKLEGSFFKDIVADDVAFLRSCVGKPTKIQNFDENGHAELEFVRSKPGENYRSHTVWVDQSWIEKV
jgi:hypothetical protein